MKIVHVINSLATGGAERLVVDLAAHGRSEGHEIKIVLLRHSEGIPQQLADDLNLPIEVIGKSLMDPRHLLRLRKATAEADIVHVHLFPAQYWAFLIKTPMVFTEHNTHNRRMKKKRFYIPERFSYRKYPLILAISEGVKAAIEEHLDFLHLSKEVIVAVNGIGNEFFELEQKHRLRPSRLVAVGSLSARKQHHLAIEAVSHLPEVTLSIAGDGPLRPELENLVSKLGLESRVTLLGNVKDMTGLLQKSDLFLSTSIVEGFGIAAGEAQAAGLPVVGPNIPGLREVILNRESGLLFDSFQSEEIANSIRQVLREDTYQKYSQNARKNAERFSIARSFAAQMNAYNALLS